MMRALSLLLLTYASLVLGALPVSAETSLRFVAPNGFVDALAPDAAARCVPPDEADRARAAGFHAYAVDVRCPGDVRARFAVKEDPLDGPVTDGYVERTITAARQSAARTGATFDVRERSLVTIAGVHGARLVFDLAPSGEHVRTLMYLVPDGPRVALLTYQTEPERFDEYLPRFEESAAATSGGREASGGSSVSASILGMMSAILLLLALKKYGGRSKKPVPERR
ncbi:hypothetical protein WME99_44965 [Sorangium sp. So ce136]|uniref:hypothetical protein n=1 Tax=Sorangium sp. So ce136 TaxID=3133284 RepID=UPI003F0CD212